MPPAANTGDTIEPRRSGRIASRPVPPAEEVKAKPRAVKKRTVEQSNDSAEAEGSSSKKVRYDSLVRIVCFLDRKSVV